MPRYVETLNETTPRPKFGVPYFIRHVMMGTYGPYPGDSGVIIPKLLENASRNEQLIRQGFLADYNAAVKRKEIGKDKHECGGCGNRFISMRDRDNHYRKRHGKRSGPKIVNIEDLTEEQRQSLKFPSGLTPKDDEYYTSPQDFHVADPLDHETALEEREAEERAPLHWDKTAASRKR